MCGCSDLAGGAVFEKLWVKEKLPVLTLRKAELKLFLDTPRSAFVHVTTPQSCELRETVCVSRTCVGFLKPEAVMSDLH